MPNYKRPGTYVEEALLPQMIESDGTATAVGAFLGTSGRGPTTATLVSSWSEFVRYFGTFDINHNLHFALFSFFANGGRSAYVARVVGSGSAKASVTLTDRAATPAATMRVDAVNPGTWANSSSSTTGLSVEVVDNATTDRFDLVVYQGGAGSPSNLNAVERFNDLSMDANDARYVVRQVNSNSDYVAITDLNSATAPPADRPSASGVKTLAGGSDGSAPGVTNYVNALTFGNVSAVFDTVPLSLILNVPDVQRLDDSVAVQILQAAGLYADQRGDVFVVCDASPGSTTANTAVTFASSVMAGGQSGSNMAIYYPYITIQDPLGAAGMTRDIAAGGAIVGLYAATDAILGPQKAPAGIGVSINQAVATKVRLTNADLDALNSAAVPVNAIRSIPGAGTCLMGARTMRTLYSDRYINVRRTLIYLKKSLTDATQFAIFENNDERLWAQLITVCTNLLTQFWQQGGLRGSSADEAFYVKCDATINTNAVIQQGEVRIEIGVALQTPAEYVVIRIGQTQGGATVTSDNNQ